jgi:hypothetical protein
VRSGGGTLPARLALRRHGQHAAGLQHLRGSDDLRLGSRASQLVPYQQLLALVPRDERGFRGQVHRSQQRAVLFLHPILTAILRLLDAALTTRNDAAALLGRRGFRGENAHHGAFLVAGALSLPEGKATALSGTAGAADGLPIFVAALLARVCTVRECM